MKINFRHPKYVIPLITVPFLAFVFFIFGGKLTEDKKGTPNEKA